MNEHEKINYIELPATELERTKMFFGSVFNWQFKDYGPDYTAFFGAGLKGGFYKSDLMATTEKGSALLVFYSQDLEHTLQKIEQHHGSIIKPVFTFPGGRRFHFTDPSGNEYAVWSE